MSTTGLPTVARAAIQWDRDSGWSIEEITVDPPGPHEVMVRVAAAGLCHSDAEMMHGGYGDLRRPVIGGHEGSGVVEAVGQGTTLVAPGDHVVFCVPAPACGHCPACTDGMTHLCEQGALIPKGFPVADGRARHHARGQDLSVFVLLGTFATHTVVHELSCAPIDRSIPLDLACVIGCAGVTGWGAAQNTAAVQPGDVVVVVGVGGVGACALLGAAFNGARHLIAVDPLGFKRDMANRFGATHAVASIDEAQPLIRDLTRGRMANKVIMAMAVGDGSYLHSALQLVGKQGRVVIVNVHPDGEMNARVSLRDLQSYEKQVVGCLSGSWHGRRGVPFLADLYRLGRFHLDDLVTKRYTLNDLTPAFQDQQDGRVIRAVVVNHLD